VMALTNQLPKRTYYSSADFTVYEVNSFCLRAQTSLLLLLFFLQIATIPVRPSFSLQNLTGLFGLS